MKLQLTQRDRTVTINLDGDDQTASEMVTCMRELLLASGYHPYCISAHMPNEAELDEIIADMINPDIKIDSDEGLTDYTP